MDAGKSSLADSSLVKYFISVADILLGRNETVTNKQEFLNLIYYKIWAEKCNGLLDRR